MSPRVLFTCGREPEYPRNEVMRLCLEHSCEVMPITDSSRSALVRHLRLFWRLLWVPWNQVDLVFVGFLGHLLLPFVRILTRKPVVLDAFVSVYDTLCFDRQVFSPMSPAGRLALWLDRFCCKLADLIILDTQTHVRYFNEIIGIAHNKLRSVYVGCNEGLFYPRSSESTMPGEAKFCLVLFYGGFLPLQGVEVIVRAAKLLENEAGLHFRIIGKGMLTPQIEGLVNDIKLTNIDFYPPVPLSTLPDQISQADICLGGHFGASAKAGRVIAGKTFQCLAMGKATIVGDNDANRELLSHGQDAWFCRMNDPNALAEAIQTLYQDSKMRHHLGQQAYQTFMKKASIQVLSGPIGEIVASLLTQPPRTETGN